MDESDISISQLLATQTPLPLWELVVEPLILPLDLDFSFLFYRGDWDPAYDSMSVHSRCWYPGSLSDNELSIRYCSIESGIFWLIDVHGMELRIASNGRLHCWQALQRKDGVALRLVFAAIEMVS